MPSQSCPAVSFKGAMAISHMGRTLTLWVTVRALSPSSVGSESTLPYVLFSHLRQAGRRVTAAFSLWSIL